MSEKLKLNLSQLALIVGICAGVFGAIQAYAVLPYRVEETEKAIRSIQDELKGTREILIRIEERVINLTKGKQ